MIESLLMLVLSLPAVRTVPAESDAKPAPLAKEPKDAKPTKAKMPDDVKALVDRMQRFYEKTEDFSADFAPNEFLDGASE